MSRIAVFCLTALGLSACKSLAEAQSPPTPQDTISGWIIFRSEFLIYPERVDIGRVGDQSCISGIFDIQSKSKAAYRRFNKRYVKVTGQLLSEKTYFTESGLGQRAENYCASDRIMIATKIEAATPPKKKADLKR
jgi:hypothetical protein